MSNAALMLGPMLFRDFEMPDRVGWGGAQRLSVHRLASGLRVIDALGRDDADIVWNGVFTGEDAPQRARALDLMRTGGAVWPLTWNWYNYSVVVASFRAEYLRPNWIPYRISCKVLRDESAGTLDAAVPIAAALNGDLAAADGFGSGVALGAAIVAVSATDAATRGSVAFGRSRYSLATALRQFDVQIAAAEAGLNHVPASADDLNWTTGLAGQLASLTTARGYVRRAEANLANADG
jgi:hypothetical protein